MKLASPNSFVNNFLIKDVQKIDLFENVQTKIYRLRLVQFNFFVIEVYSVK